MTSDLPLPHASPAYRWAVAALLAVGVGLAWLTFGSAWPTFISLGPFGPTALVALLAVIVGVVSVRASGAAVVAGLRRWDAAVDRRPATVAGVMAVSSAAYVWWTAVGQGRSLTPYVHDEFSYLIQAHQLAHLHGWYRPHPLAQFFDSFQLFVRPAYASAYFPGTALLFVPGVWLGLPAWVTAVAVAGAVAGLLFRLIAELAGGVAAVVAVVLLWTDGEYRALGTMTMAQLPLLTAGLTATLAWLRWRATGHRRWAATVGLALSWAAVTRPVDALCFAGPIGVAVAADVLRRRRRPSALAWMAAAAVPLLALQLTLNRGITGHWTETPFRRYADLDYPGAAYGFHRYDPRAAPASTLPQKRVLYDIYRPVIADHTPASMLDVLIHGHGFGGLSPARLSITLFQVLPLLIPLVPVAAATIRGGTATGRAVLLVTVPLFVAVYVGYVFFFPHYALTATPGLILAVLLGGQAGAAALPPAWVERGRAAVSLGLLAVGIAGLPQVDPGQADVLFPSPALVEVERQLAALAHRPAVVLFAYDGHRDVNQEPVYNPGAAWPDEAAIVRAHDLGPAADAELFRYYAARGPPRYAYRYDEATATLTPLGPVADLARHPPGRF